MKMAFWLASGVAPPARERYQRALLRCVRDGVGVINLADDQNKARLLGNLERVSGTQFDVVRRILEIPLPLPDVDYQPAGNRRSAQRVENSLPLLRSGLLQRAFFGSRSGQGRFDGDALLLEPLDQILPALLLHFSHADTFEHRGLRKCRQRQPACAAQ
jgi:hypothetical protein